MLPLDFAANIEDNPPSHMEYDSRTHSSYFNKDYVAAELLTIGSKLTNPVCWCSSYVHRIISPLDPGVGDCRGSFLEEFLARGIYTLKFSLLSPLSVPLGGAGVGFRYVAGCLLSKGFCFLKGNAEPLRHLQDRSLSIMSWNICGLAGSMDRSHGGVKDWAYRFDRIEALIKKANPDILCLQEAHDTDLIDKLYKTLKDTYAYFYIHIGPKTIGSNSGNFIASKYRIRDFQFAAFKDKTGSNTWQQKGFVKFTVVANQAPKLSVVATHFQHGEIIDEKANIIGVRKGQLSQILESTEASINKLPILLVGDLNIDEDSQEYEDSYLSTHFTHGYLDKEPTSTDQLIKITWDKELIANGNFDQKIDYISFLNKDPISGEKLYHPKLSVTLLKVYDVDEPYLALSDHHALLGEIQFRK